MTIINYILWGIGALTTLVVLGVLSLWGLAHLVAKAELKRRARLQG
jgi:hypothetical protein